MTTSATNSAASPVADPKAGTPPPAEPKTYSEIEMSALLKRAEVAEARANKYLYENRGLRKLEWYTALDQEERDRFYQAYTSQEKFQDILAKRYNLDETDKRLVAAIADPEEAELAAQRFAGLAVPALGNVDKALADIGLARPVPTSAGTSPPTSPPASIAPEASSRPVGMPPVPAGVGDLLSKDLRYMTPKELAEYEKQFTAFYRSTMGAS